MINCIKGIYLLSPIPVVFETCLHIRTNWKLSRNTHVWMHFWRFCCNSGAWAEVLVMAFQEILGALIHLLHLVGVTSVIIFIK